MDDLNSYQYFVHVVDHGGFSAAARSLGTTKSRLSRRIGQLEDHLGVRLLQRSTRRFSLTEAGRAFYEHAKAMVIEADAATSAIRQRQTEPRGVVRISCPETLLELRVGNMLAEFLATCPLVELHLDASNRRVDVIGEGIDIALRVRPPPLEDSDLVLRVLGHDQQRLVASPRLFQTHPKPEVPEHLASLPSLVLAAPQPRHTWHLLGPTGENMVIPHQPRLVTRGMSLLRAAALAGVGVVQLPDMLVQEDLARGDLLELVPRWSPPREVIHAVYPSRRGMLPVVRSLLDHLLTKFRDLEPN